MDNILNKNIQKALLSCWSKYTLPENLFDKNNPPYNQCFRTSLVIYKMFGGKLFKTNNVSHGSAHFYNFIDGNRYDFTKGQFETDDDSYPSLYGYDDIEIKENELNEYMGEYLDVFFTHLESCLKKKLDGVI